jgi:hypothetical protein
MNSFGIITPSITQTKWIVQNYMWVDCNSTGMYGCWKFVGTGYCTRRTRCVARCKKHWDDCQCGAAAAASNYPATLSAQIFLVVLNPVKHDFSLTLTASRTVSSIWIINMCTNQRAGCCLDSVTRNFASQRSSVYYISRISKSVCLHILLHENSYKHLHQFEHIHQAKLRNVFHWFI